MTSSMDGTDPFLSIPVELVREVMEYAACIDPPFTALSLSLVSKDINRWITPFLYHTVFLDTAERIRSFNNSLEVAENSASGGKARLVTNLAIRGTAMGCYGECLCLCTNVQRLLLRPEDATFESSQSSSALWPRPWHIMLLSLFDNGLEEGLSLFSNTTHLYLDEGLHPDIIPSCLSLPLTHICVGVWGDQERASNVRTSVELLLSVHSMQIVLVHAFVSGHPIEDFYGGVWAELANIADERLFVAPGMYDDDLIEMFESEKTVWDRGGEFKDWRQQVQEFE